MESGNLMRQTAAGRVAVRPECLAELMSLLAVRMAQARRGRRVGAAVTSTGLVLWGPNSSDHYKAIERALRYLIATIGESVLEIEFDLAYMQIQPLIRSLLGPSDHLGRHKPEVSHRVLDLIISSGSGEVGPRLLGEPVPNASPPAIAGRIGPDSRKDSTADAESNVGGQHTNTKDSRRARRSRKGGNASAKGRKNDAPRDSDNSRGKPRGRGEA